MHIPPEVNAYRWLRGQNHYDSFRLSGVSGASARSYYYPEKAHENCNGCHMPLAVSKDFGAKVNDTSGKLTVHDHLVGANTALPVLVDSPEKETIIERHRQLLKKAARIDIFGVRDGPEFSAPLCAPLRPEFPSLVAGNSYVIESGITEPGYGAYPYAGNSDSDQLWLEVTASADGRVFGQSGMLDRQLRVDPWAYFVNTYMLDRNGIRIDRRNVEDIFVPLYNHQIGPGSAAVVHYRLDIPADVAGSRVELTARLNYRKFDTAYLRAFSGSAAPNLLPITEMTADSVTLPLSGTDTARKATLTAQRSPIETWQRWNDYGIGLIGHPELSWLRESVEAFEQVQRLNRVQGPMNLVRAYLKHGMFVGQSTYGAARGCTLQRC